ncbi:hypothetical protein WCE10_21585, partial [Cronobacter muytjensii]|uniref:hypothetical protein n=1 Tax=Cronobacter muytjensii TaxID=413501 RepID=UPI0034D55E40
VVFGGKLYRFTGGAYTTKVESTDVNGKFTRDSIAANTITSNEIAANSISSNRMLISDTLNYTENANFDFGNVGWILQNNRGAASVRSRDDIGAGNTYNGSRYVGYTPFNSETVYRNKGHLSVKPGDELYAYVLGHLTNGTAYSR